MIEMLLQTYKNEKYLTATKLVNISVFFLHIMVTIYIKQVQTYTDQPLPPVNIVNSSIIIANAI